MAVVIAQVSGRRSRMLVHGLCLHVSAFCIPKLSRVHDLHNNNEVYLHGLAEASSANQNTTAGLCFVDLYSEKMELL